MSNVTKINGNAMKLKRGSMLDRSYIQALGKLFNFGSFGDVQTIGSLMKLQKLIREAAEETEGIRMELVKQHAELDGDDNPIIEKGVYRMKDKDVFDEEFKSLLDQTAPCDIVKISYKKAKQVNLSPAELNLLSDVIELPPELIV